MEITHEDYAADAALSLDLCGGWQLTNVCDRDGLGDFVTLDPFEGTVTVNNVNTEGQALTFEDNTFNCVSTFKYPMDSTETSQIDIPFSITLISVVVEVPYSPPVSLTPELDGQFYTVFSDEVKIFEFGFAAAVPALSEELGIEIDVEMSQVQSFATVSIV